MRSFVCRIADRHSDEPVEAFIVAANAERAHELAQREAANWKDAVVLDLREKGRMVWRRA